MAIESVAPGSNILHFPTPVERGRRQFRHVECLADIQIAAGEVQWDVFVLAAGRAWLDLPKYAESIPLLLTTSACGRLELVDVIADEHIRSGYEFVCSINRNSHQGHVAARIRDHFQARWSA